MPRKRQTYDSSSSDGSFQQNFSSSRRRLPSPPPTGILRNANRHVTIVDPASMSRRVDRIADSLEDTSRNLQGVDTKLSDFKDVHDDSMSALTKLQEDLEGSINRLRTTREKRATGRPTQTQSLHHSDLYRRSASASRVGQPREPTSPMKEYEHDFSDYSTGRSLRRPASSLGISRKRENVEPYSSGVREKVLNLSASQVRLEQDMNDEIAQRMRNQADTRRSLRELNDTVRGENATDRVERRLKEIERGMQADRNSATQFASDIAGDVLRRSQSKPTEEEGVVRGRLLQVEAGKRAVETELEATRRRLEQSEGGREALMSQIGELRALINRSDKERISLQHQVEQQALSQRAQLEKEANTRQKHEVSERQERDRMRQENEIADLRAALKRSAGVVQLDETRRELEKSERQRQQLSDHIEVLTKDLEKKEQAQVRVLNQHHDLQRAYDESERDRDRLSLQLEDALRKLKEQARDTEKHVTDLRRVEQSKGDCEKEKEELRSVAQETIRQWKTKCRKNEKEIERLRENVEQLTTRNEEMVKENIASKTQANNAYQQAENLRKEMEDLIAKRADLEERLHRRENDNEEICEEKRNLLRQLNDAAQTADKQDSKLRELKEKMTSSSVRLVQIEEEAKGSKSMYEAAKKQLTDLQSELRDVKIQNADLESRLASENRERHDAQKSAQESNSQIMAMKSELSAVHKQLQIERDTHKRELQDLRSDIHSGEVGKMEAVQRVSKKADEERAFLEGEIHRVNMEANEAKAATREAQKLLAKAKEELNLLGEEASRLDDDNRKMREKYHIVKSSYENKCADVALETNRAQQIEDTLLTSRDHVRRLEQEVEQACSALSREVAALESALDLEVEDTTLGEPTDRRSRGDGTNWAVSLKRRLEIVKKDLKHKMGDRTKVINELDRNKEQMKTMCRSMDDDRRQLMCEVTEQNKLVDTLSREKTSLLLENKEARMIVHDLEDRVANLTTDLENSKLRFLENFSMDLPSKLTSVDPEESQKERERIQERYMKYKDTIESLQAELEEPRCRGRGSPDRNSGSLRLGPGKSPSPIKRVTISDSSPVIHGYSSARPRSSSPMLPEKER
uniref:Centrosomal protein of 128 kDa-like n=1 Tax=Phallusia mammillata TaxID=59560 RepID=A0A6F9D8G6_9ASCI|nr:centrosomal protein of 128 kDa-like [Phallusia mammillata]